MNKTEQSVRSISGQSEISASNSSRLPQLNSKVLEKEKLSKLNPQITEMDRAIFYHWVATREIMEIIRRRNEIPETRTLVEQKALSRPGTLRRRYDPHFQRTLFALLRPNTAESE